jgi:hypothetical protein
MSAFGSVLGKGPTVFQTVSPLSKRDGVWYTDTYGDHLVINFQRVRLTGEVGFACFCHTP